MIYAQKEKNKRIHGNSKAMKNKEKNQQDKSNEKGMKDKKKMKRRQTYPKQPHKERIKRTLWQEAIKTQRDEKCKKRQKEDNTRRSLREASQEIL